MEYLKNSKIGHLTRFQNNHLYTQEIHPTWTSIERISKEIQIGSNFDHIITQTQFPIQLVDARCLHGLSLDYLAFDPTGIYKHGLTYTALSRIKNYIYFNFFQLLITNEAFPN